MDGDKTITATFTEDPIYTLTVIQAGSGGTVTPTAGSHTYVSGTSVPVSAVADAGWTFTGWSGDLTGTTATSISMDSDKTITATFTQESYTLTVVQVGTGGTVTPTVGGHTYLSNTVVGVSAVADAGWTFTGWSGDLTGTTATSITMDGDKTITATFTQESYTLTILQVGNGTVTPLSGGSYLSGTTVPLSAVADAGWSFSDWSGIGFSSTDPSESILMDGNKTITATFIQESYTLTIIQVGNGTVTPVSGGSYLSGTTVPLSAVADAGWSFSDWSGIGFSSTDPSESILMDGNKTITATFTQESYTLTILQVGNGTVTPVSGGSYLSGTTVPLSAVADAGWSFSNWAGTGFFSIDASTSIQMDGDKTITATFTQDSYTLTILQVGDGTVTPVSGGSYPSGTTVPLSAVADAGWSFSDWSGIGFSSTDPSRAS